MISFHFLKKIVDCRNFGDIFILGNLPEVTWLAGFSELLLATVEPIFTEFWNSTGSLQYQATGGFGVDEATGEPLSGLEEATGEPLSGVDFPIFHSSFCFIILKFS